MAGLDADPLKRESAFLYGLLELIGCLDVRAAMQKVADLGHLVIGARTCNVRLLSQAGDTLDLVGTRGATSEEHLRNWRPLGCTSSVVGVVFRTGQHYEQDNIQGDPHYEMKEFAARRQLVALRADPIMLDGAVVGVITLYFLRPEELSPERRILASMLARFAGSVLEMQRREQQWTTASPQGLADPELAQAQTVREAASTVAQRALAVSRCQAAGVLLPRGEIGGLENEGEAGHVELLAHPGVAALARTAFSMDAVQDSPIEPRNDLLFPGRHVSAFPCSVGTQRVGILTVVGVQEGPLDPSVSRSLVYLAARSAGVLLRLQDREWRQAIDEFLATLGVGTQERLDPDNLRSFLLDYTRRRLGVEGAVLYLWDPAVQRYTPRTARGLKNIRRPIDYAKDGYALGEWFVGEVAQHGSPVFLRNPERELVDQDPCLSLVRRQTHTRDLTLCVGIPIHMHGTDVPVAVAVFADGRPGAGPLQGIGDLQGAGLLSLIEQGGAMARAEEILGRQNELFYAATHKAMGPLAKIMQAIEVIDWRGWRSSDLPQLAKWAEQAMRNVEQLLRVQRALYQRTVEPKDTDVSSLVAGVVEDFRLVAEGRGCTLAAQLQPECHALTVGSYAQDVFDIVLDNAIKYAPESGGCVQVRLSAVGGVCELSVEDNGPGLPREVRESLTAGSGVQLRAGYGFQRGMGLGLFVVMSYVRLLGWDVQIIDRAPSGTSFVFRMGGLPQNPDAQGAGQ